LLPQKVVEVEAVALEQAWEERDSWQVKPQTLLPNRSLDGSSGLELPLQPLP